MEKPKRVRGPERFHKITEKLPIMRTELKKLVHKFKKTRDSIANIFGNSLIRVVRFFIFQTQTIKRGIFRKPAIKKSVSEFSACD